MEGRMRKKAGGERKEREGISMKKLEEAGRVTREKRNERGKQKGKGRGKEGKAKWKEVEGKQGGMRKGRTREMEEENIKSKVEEK